MTDAQQTLKYDFSTILFIFFLGVLTAILIPAIFHFSPLYIDCGCGAQAEMARQCFESNCSSWQCGVFK